LRKSQKYNTIIKNKCTLYSKMSAQSLLIPMKQTLHEKTQYLAFIVILKITNILPFRH